MHFKKSNDNFPFSTNRFETTYGNSYNKSYNYPNRINFTKLTENNVNSNILENKPKSEINSNFLLPKTFNKLNTETSVKPINSNITNVQLKSKENQIQYIPSPSEVIKQYDYNHMVTQIAKITDNLYLSSLHAISADRLKTIGITLVVSLIAETSVMRLPSAIQRLQINIEDTENVNIRRHFDSVLERMNQEIHRQGRILVHCVAGISRSSTIVIAYLMRYQNMRLREAYNLVHSQRPYIQPNLGFWRQLIEYERSIFGSVSVNMVPMTGTRILIPDVTPSILSEILSSTPMLRLQPRSMFPVRTTYGSY